MKALVIGGTGTVGSLVVEQLIRAGVSVRILTRDAAKAAALHPSVMPVVGDLRDPEGAAAAFRDVEAVFMLNAASPSEGFEGLVGVMLARAAGVKRFVYMSTYKAHLTPWLPFGGGSKLAIERAVQTSGMSHTILRPNAFHQNDVWYKQSIMEHGVYPQPLGHIGMQRIDAREIAEIARIALTTEGHNGKVYGIVGPRVETGPSSARVWSEVLNKPVVYPEDALETFKTTHAFMGSALTFPYHDFFVFYGKHGLIADPGDLEQTTELLGRMPASLETFAREIGPTWLKEGPGSSQK